MPDANRSYSSEGDPLGLITPDEVLTTRPDWRGVYDTASVVAEAAAALGSVERGAEVDVYLAFWCGDSRREVPRLKRALDQAGPLPFAVRYISVDRAKSAPDQLTDGADLRFVPTVVVRRAGTELGRVVESAPQGVEVAVLNLLRGAARGIISGRPDLQSRSE